MPRCDICLQIKEESNNPAPVLHESKSCCNNCNTQVLIIRIALAKLGYSWGSTKVMTLERAYSESVASGYRWKE